MMITRQGCHAAHRLIVQGPDPQEVDCHASEVADARAGQLAGWALGAECPSKIVVSAPEESRRDQWNEGRDDICKQVTAG
jgi:hypothetical protein